MQTCTRRFTFDAAHRVKDHDSKCRHIHGHTYVAEVTVRPAADYAAPGQGLNALGMVVDFSVLKTHVGRWIEEHWDHNIILHPRDNLVRLGEALKDRGIWANKFAVFNDRAPYLMPEDTNPTAENLARELYRVATIVLQGHNIVVTHVRIQETPNCWADYRPDLI